MNIIIKKIYLRGIMFERKKEIFLHYQKETMIKKGIREEELLFELEKTRKEVESWYPKIHPININCSLDKDLFNCCGGGYSNKEISLDEVIEKLPHEFSGRSKSNSGYGQYVYKVNGVTVHQEYIS